MALARSSSPMTSLYVGLPLVAFCSSMLAAMACCNWISSSAMVDGLIQEHLNAESVIVKDAFANGSLCCFAFLLSSVDPCGVVWRPLFDTKLRRIVLVNFL
ncbi:hypothetical protein CCACVL1_11398 [Corchorus capsularis]|uniref:Uncharacterized protein n=1 Tax=Corchorus capsularis TaxID=210143 RepID=A0A1R3ILG7_COCAP|nr:hypothetical protein CCACVL1_11398 [Corchorus capsularis]